MIWHPRTLVSFRANEADKRQNLDGKITKTRQRGLTAPSFCFKSHYYDFSFFSFQASNELLFIPADHLSETAAIFLQSVVVVVKTALSEKSYPTYDPRTKCDSQKVLKLTLKKQILLNSGFLNALWMCKNIQILPPRFEQCTPTIGNPSITALLVMFGELRQANLLGAKLD